MPKILRARKYFHMSNHNVRIISKRRDHWPTMQCNVVPTASAQCNITWIDELLVGSRCADIVCERRVTIARFDNHLILHCNVALSFHLNYWNYSSENNVTSSNLTRDAGPKTTRGFLGFAEKSPRGPYIVGQARTLTYDAGPTRDLAGFRPCVAGQARTLRFLYLDHQDHARGARASQYFLNYIVIGSYLYVYYAYQCT